MEFHANHFQNILLSLVGGPVLIGVGMISFRKRQLMANTPTSKVRSASMGLVELRGFSIPWKQPLISPVTRTPCCWWRCRVEKRVQSGKSSHWATVSLVTSPLPFYLEDETGRMLVEPNGADILARSTRNACNGSEPYLAELGVFAERSVFGAFSAFSFSAFSRMRVTEECIPSGGPFYALGELAKREVLLKERRLRYQEKIRAAKQDRETMARADLNRDGEVSIPEWEVFRQKLEADFILEEEKAGLNKDQLALRKPLDESTPMILSIGDERRASGKLLGVASLMIPGGIAASAFGVFLMNRFYDRQTTLTAWFVATIVGLALSRILVKLKMKARKKWL